MFEMRPYSRKNNSVYNPFREMEEFEKTFSAHRSAFSIAVWTPLRQMLRTRVTITS